MSKQRRGSDSVYFTNLLKIWDLESDGIDRKTLLEAGGLSLLKSNTPLPVARSCRYRTDKITGMPQSSTLQPVTSKYRTENTPDTLQSNTPQPVASRNKKDETPDTLQSNTPQPVASRYEADETSCTLQSNTPQPVAARYEADETSCTLQSNMPLPVAARYKADETPGTLQSNTLRPVATRYKADETYATSEENKMKTVVSSKSAAKPASSIRVCTDVLNSTFESLSDFDLFCTSSDNDSIHTPQSPGLSHCCPSCDYHNSYGANWCMECGTVLTGCKQPRSSEDKSQAGSIQAHTPHGVTHNSVRRQTTLTIGVVDGGIRSMVALSPERGLTESRPACNTNGMTDSSIGLTIASSPDRRSQTGSTQACNMIHGSSNLRQPFTHSETIDNHSAVPKLSEIHHYNRNAVLPSRRSCKNLHPLYSDLSQLLLHNGNLRYSRSTVPSTSRGRESSAAESTCRLQQQHSQRNPHCDNASHYRRLPNMDHQKQHVTDSPLQDECRVADKHLTTEMGSQAVMCHSEHTLSLNETPSLSLLTGQVLGCKLSPAPPFSEPAPPFSEGPDRAHVSSEDENVQRSSESRYVRHWDTSGVYMWRKPSTLASRKSRMLGVSAPLHLQHLAENGVQQPAAETVTTDVLQKGDTASYVCHPNHGAPCKKTINTSCTATIGKCEVNVPPLDVGKMEEDQSTLKPVSHTICMLCMRDYMHMSAVVQVMEHV